MRLFLLAALAFHMTLGPVCMMHTAYAAEHHHDMATHEASLDYSSSDCPDCFAAHAPVTAASHCVGDCISVHTPDLLSFAPVALELPLAIMPLGSMQEGDALVPVALTFENHSVAPPSFYQSVVLLL